MGEDYNKEVDRLFEKCAKNLKKNMNYSQVLLKLSKDEKSLTKVEEIIQKSSIFRKILFLLLFLNWILLM